MMTEKCCAQSSLESGVAHQFEMKAPEQSEQSMFSSQWDIYKSVIEHNYMYHAELIEIVKKVLNHFKAPSILDLGCGDSYIVSESLGSNHEIDYWGVDSAAMALESGRENLDQVKGDINLINEDLLKALEGMKRSFDIIISGYSLHHLEAEDKKKCFSLISNLISDEGVLIFYDLENEPDEAPYEYIKRVCDIFDKDWDKFDEKTLEDIRGHVEANDLPENEKFYQENFERVGFSDVEKVFRDKDKMFSAYTARKAR